MDGLLFYISAVDKSNENITQTVRHSLCNTSRFLNFACGTQVQAQVHMETIKSKSQAWSFISRSKK